MTVGAAAPTPGRPRTAGLATALPWAGTAAVIGAGSALLAQGHDGLAVTLGLAVAAFLWVALLAPTAQAMAPGRELPSALAVRADSPLLGTTVRALLVVAAVLLVAAEVSIARAGLDLLLGGRASGWLVAVAATAVLALVFAVPLRRRLDGFAAAVLAAVAAVVILAVGLLVWRSGPAAVLAIPAVPDITALEQRLIATRLADPAQLRAHTAPFLRTDAANFVALAAVVAAGFAAVVGGYGRAHATPAARRTAALVVLGLVVLLPAVAAHGKWALLAAVDAGVKVASPPPWVADAIAAGLVEACGKPAATTVAEACGRGFGPQGLLRWQDVVFAREGLPYAALDASGAPRLASALLVLAALVAGALLAARASMALVTPERLTPADDERAGLPARLAAVAAVVAAVAAVALSGLADFVTLLALAAAVAACAVMPAVLAGFVWARPSGIAAVAAAGAGVVLALTLMLAPRVAPVTTLEVSGALTSSPPGVARRVATLAAPAPSVGPPAEAQRAAAQRATAHAHLVRIAEERVTWLGLKPLASGAWGVLLALVVAAVGNVVGTVVLRRR